MEYSPSERKIELKRKLNNLDLFVKDFCELLGEYVLVSGYVSILFGRSRGTEDVDLLIPKMDEEKFKELWEKIHKHNFECINTGNPDEAFKMLGEHAIRFSRIGKPVPNMEFKLIKNKNDEYSFNNKIKVIIEGGFLFISPLEMQIAYKLGLGSNKDLEDAKHLYEIFKEKINKEELLRLVEDLEVESEFKLIKEENETRFKKT